jgi:hypothetical protein
MSMGRVLRRILTLTLLTLHPFTLVLRKQLAGPERTPSALNKTPVSSWRYVPTSGLTIATTCTGIRLWFRTLSLDHLLPVPAAPFPPLLIPAAHARFSMVVHCFLSQLLP